MPGASRRMSLLAYVLAVGLSVAALAARLSLDPVWGLKLPYLLFFPVIALSGLLGGLGPGLIATLICAVGSAYLWIDPVGSLQVAHPADVVGLTVFVLIGVFMSALNDAWRRMTAAVARAEQRLRVTFTSIGDAVITTDATGAVTFLNPVAQRLTGWSDADARGQPLESVFVIVNEATRQAVENPIRRVLREGVMAGLANGTVLLARGGGEIPIEDSAAPIKDEAGEVGGVVLVFREITERRRIERERAAALAREREAHERVRAAEQQLQLALDAGRMGTWHWTLATGAVKWSPGLEAIHGLAAGTFPGTIQAFRDEIHPDDRELVQQSATLAIGEGRDHHVEYRIVRSDGTVRWVEGRGRVVCDPAGQPLEMLGVCLDVTERRRAEERFRLAVDAAPTAMVVVDRDGTITLVNALVERLTGYGREELIGQSIECLVPLDSRPDHVSHRDLFFRDARQRPMGVGRELHVLRKDGSAIPVEIGLSPIETTDGTYVIAAVTDITERRRAAQAEREAKEAAEHANRAKDEFLAVLSHELRNPINAILGWAQLLRTGVPPELTGKGLEVIERNARNEARLVESLLEVSRIIAGKLTLEMEAVDLTGVARAALDVVRPTADLKGVQLTWALPPSALPITGDPGRLQQVLWNLLSNAVKFTPRGGEVRLSVTSVGSRAILEVRDTGEGIAAEFLPQVFGRFTQADAGKARTHGGLGLGLAIVRELVYAHGGTVAAASPGKGQGAVFTVTLPVAAAAVVTETGLAAGGLPNLRELRVLVVDDEQDARDLLALTLSGHGAVVETARSAEEALALLHRDLPDALVADIGMPHQDGYALIRRIRQLWGARPLPAIALTAYATPADRDEALAAGFDLHLAKPVEAAELVRAIASCCAPPPTSASP